MKKNIFNLFLCLLMLFTFNANSLAFAEEANLNLKGSIAAAYDLETGELVYAQNLEEIAYPASITKLMTALVFAENMNKTDMLTYTEIAASQPAFSYGKNVEMVLVGDEMQADDAMDALILFSGNDIAYMIAENVAGSVDSFVKMMNDKAKELGMVSTNFVTPNGLDEGIDNHLTTAYDLILLTKAAYENDWVRETMMKKTSTVRTLRSIPREITNRNKNIGVDGCIGGKTGYTDKAGRCLATVYERDGRIMVGVVMKSEFNPEDTVVFEDMNKLMDYAYSAEKEVYHSKDKPIESIDFEYNLIPFIGPKKSISIPVFVNEDITLYDNGIEPTLKSDFNDFSLWKLNSDTSIGKLTLTQKDYNKTIDLYTNFTVMDLIKENLVIYLTILIGLILLIIVIVRLVLKFKKKNRRTYGGFSNSRRRRRW